MKKIFIGLLAFGTLSSFAAKQQVVEVKVLRLENGTSVTQNDIRVKEDSQGYYESGSILVHGLSTKNDEVKFQCHKSPIRSFGVFFFNNDKNQAHLSFDKCKTLAEEVKENGISNIVVQRVSIGRGKNQYSKWQVLGVDKH